jgi:hypothetical protein
MVQKIQIFTPKNESCVDDIFRLFTTKLEMNYYYYHYSYYFVVGWWHPKSDPKRKYWQFGHLISYSNPLGPDLGSQVPSAIMLVNQVSSQASLVLSWASLLCFALPSSEDSRENPICSNSFLFFWSPLHHR